MSFVHQPTQFEPDPWPVNGPAELSENEYQHALANIDSPYISNILGRLGNITSSEVIVWLLFLGISYKAGGETIKGYYIRAVVRNRRALDRDIRALAAPATFAFAKNPNGQLALSVRMIPLAEGETRRKVVGWGFAGK